MNPNNTPDQPQNQPQVPAPAAPAPNPAPSVNPVVPEQAQVPEVASEAPVQPEVPAPAQSQAPDLTAIFDQIAEKIIEQQEAIIGPIAVEQAKLVTELKVDWAQHDVDIEGSPQIAIDDLVAQYKELFGQIAVETCKEAVANLLSQVPADQQPSSLKTS